MKQAIGFNPTFIPASRTLNFSGYAGFDISKLYAVINVTQDAIIYAAGSSSAGFSAFSNGVLTLDFDTTSHNAGDQLLVLYDVGATALPTQNDEYMPVRPLPQKKWRTTFASVIASGVDPAFFTAIQTGSGQTVAQSGGNLVLTAGTTANAETILRSVESFSDAMMMRWTTTLSQRIANNNFVVELVDIIGDGLALTVNSSTSITVTIPNNPFTAANVGQSIHIGAIAGVAAAVPGRYAIASVSGNNVTFTVAGWPGSGSGTCSLFGWNYHQVIYSGVTATSATYDAQRHGWASGATTATIVTTATGHMGIISSEDGISAFLDQSVVSATGLPTNMRASRVQNLPAQETPLFVQLRVLNGTSAPASGTTWTVGLVSVENYASQAVAIHNVKAQSFNTPLPVAAMNTVTVSGTVTANIGTGALAAGANVIGDVGQQYRAAATGAASLHSIRSAATTNAAVVKASAGKVIGWTLSNNTATWRYVKLHNTTTAPTVGSTPVVLVIGLPPNSTITRNIEGGLGFATGISRSVVTGAADSDATATGANEVVGEIFFA